MAFKEILKHRIPNELTDQLELYNIVYTLTAHKKGRYVYNLLRDTISHHLITEVLSPFIDSIKL